MGVQMNYSMVPVALLALLLCLTPMSGEALANPCQANCKASADACDKRCKDSGGSIICYGKCDTAEQACIATCYSCGSTYKKCISKADGDKEKEACKTAYQKCKGN